MPSSDYMDPQALQALLTKYRNGDATDEERAQVEAWYDALDGEAEPALPEADKRAFVEQHWQQMAAQIRLTPTHQRIPALFYRLAAAAVVVLGIGLGWYFLMNRSLVTTTHQVAAQTGRSKLVEQTNESGKPLRIALSDGSAITLQPGSQVQYPEQFAENRREVRLVGEGFFEVTKNPKRPFLVYANGLVTKVLGTSFTIVAHSGKPTAEVVVRTGRVAVYRQAGRQATGSDMVLTPNEKATFFRAESRIVKSLADHPVILRPEAIKTHFVFDDTPVTRVFRELDDVYGVTISFDAKTFANCTLTANLANQPLTSQLDMICLSIGASYQTHGTHIQISGRGCP
ncbi:anti-FecI sigma factor, FecR [Spirosoma linguale DSM 74]|uniref:Anti-FecI sigma factor, FecR n=2 Tax=Spirosoma TaxID=107 RepID=D2QRQ3_SPILD|nr:anti-FecI sigma factor, FecR [Spirosoma linguale DSM 74]